MTGSVKSQFKRSLKIFNWIVAFEAFTGGAGDADLCDNYSDDEEMAKVEYEICLKGARSQGLDVGLLTPKSIQEWYGHGWYDLFYNR